MPKVLKDSLTWIRDHVLAVLIASFVIPGVLAVFQQQADVTKAIYETDYKAAKTKFRECSDLHSDYLAASGANAGTAHILHEHFNIEAISKNGASPAYFVAFKGTMEGYQKSGDRATELFGKTSRCYADLNSLYENLALTLGLGKEFDVARKRDQEKVDALIAQRNAIAKQLHDKVDLRAIFQAMIGADLNATVSLMQSTNFGDLATLQAKNVEMEYAARSQQQVQFNELNRIFSSELSQRFQRGLFSYFWSLF